MTQVLAKPPVTLLARITGLTLLLVTLAHMAGFQIANSFVVSGDFAATSANIAQNESLFRMAIFSYIVSSVLSVGLGVGFYFLLVPISKAGAFLVLGWRLFEAIIASGAWAIRLALINNQTDPNLLGQDGAHALHIVLRDVSNAAFDISAIGLALATIIGFSIFVGAKTIPRVLSGVAVLGALIVLVTSIVTLVWPQTDLPTHIAFAVTLLSQLAIGAWLLVWGTRPSAEPNASNPPTYP
jgi:Domain of unknown function (DUF4386)